MRINFPIEPKVNIIFLNTTSRKPFTFNDIKMQASYINACLKLYINRH